MKAPLADKPARKASVATHVLPTAWQVRITDPCRGPCVDPELVGVQCSDRLEQERALFGGQHVYAVSAGSNDERGSWPPVSVPVTPLAFDFVVV